MNQPNAIAILAADVLATRAGELLDKLACGSWEPAQKLREALQCYSEVRLGVAVAEGADAVLRHINANAPVTERSVQS